MKHYVQLPVRVQFDNGASQVPALLIELQHKLAQLQNHSQSDCIDLQSLPLFPGDLERLKQSLGKGEIQVKLNAMGRSDIYETAIAGIWWITHFNQNEDIVAEILEVTLLPEILKTAPADLAEGREKLQQLVSRVTQSVEDRDISRAR